jgi:hypothetical protein
MRQATQVTFETNNVWRQSTPDLQAELVDFWTRHGALADPVRAALRAKQAVLVARDADGRIVGVGTALLRIIPRLRQPTYYYRQFFAPEFRGNKGAVPFFQQALAILEAANVEKPESIGVLLELENSTLDGRYTNAVEPRTGATFIGYSPRGFQLKVVYFKGAVLFPPAPVQRRAQGQVRRTA